MKETLEKSTKALKASFLNISTCFWLNTIVQHQYKNGNGFMKTCKILYKENGIKRFYSGYTPTVIHGTASRFCDYLAHYMMEKPWGTTKLNLTSQVVLGGLVSSMFQIMTMPLETCKVLNQLHGKQRALKILKLRLKKKPLILWKGCRENSLANFIEHVGWFQTYEYLDKNLPNEHTLLRSWFLGLTSGATTDILSNHLKIVKTMKQSTNLNYNQIVKQIIQKNGVHGLVSRGLGT